MADRAGGRYGPRGQDQGQGDAPAAATVTEAVGVVEDCGAEELIAVTTSAVRDAPNRDRVIAYVRAASGVRLDVLSGAAETHLEFLAVRRWHGWSAGPLLLLNVGGGSLKIAFGRDERPEAAISLPLGTRQLADIFLRSDPPSRAELRRLLRHVTRTMLAGAIVADTAMTVLNLRYVDICPWALREGVLLDRSGIPEAAAV